MIRSTSQICVVNTDVESKSFAQPNAQNTQFRNIIQSLYFLPTILVKECTHMCILSKADRFPDLLRRSLLSFSEHRAGVCSYSYLCIASDILYISNFSRTFSTVLSVAGFYKKTRFWSILPHEIVQQPLHSENLIMA